MPKRSSTPEKRLILIAVLFMIGGVVAGILHRLDIIPLWAGTAGMVVSAAGALWAAFAANRQYRTKING